MADRTLLEQLVDVPVWDLPTRVFHWALVALIVFSYVTAQVDAMELHKWSGLTILTLVLFRVMWGIFGGKYARFSSFVRRPRDVLAYARGLPKAGSTRFIGHNPLGGWSVILMLLCLAVQACTGLFANDDAGFEGPLAHTLSKAQSDFFSHIHTLNVNVLYVLVGLHVAAVLFYLVKKGDNLIRPMITGTKQWPGAAATEAGARGSIAVAVILLLVAAAAVFAIVR